MIDVKKRYLNRAAYHGKELRKKDVNDPKFHKKLYKLYLHLAEKKEEDHAFLYNDVHKRKTDTKIHR